MLPALTENISPPRANVQSVNPHVAEATVGSVTREWILSPSAELTETSSLSPPCLICRRSSWWEIHSNLPRSDLCPCIPAALFAQSSQRVSA